MSQDKSGHKPDASDRALDKAAQDEKSASGQGHDPEKIRQHDDVGKDRLFEGREQHDDAEKQSERNRLELDVQRHGHEPGEVGGGTS